MSAENSHEFGYMPDDDGFVRFRTLYTDYEIKGFDETYWVFVRSIMTQAEVGVMPIYRAGEPPEGTTEL